MKIIISPSKTKDIKGTPSAPMFAPHMTEQIVKHMQGVSKEALGKALKIKDAVLEEVYAFYQNYDKEVEGMAALSYDGLSFKNFNYGGLSEEGKIFANAHVWIGSALYGLVSPNSGIKGYRLDLVDSVLKEEKSNLYAWWQPLVDAAVEEEDWILNLASKEYSKWIIHPKMVTIEFLEYRNGVWKQLSTSSKQMRGSLVHYICEHRITELSKLPKKLKGFVLDSLTEHTESSFIIAYRKQA
jgi:hypothetical protein